MRENALRPPSNEAVDSDEVERYVRQWAGLIRGCAARNGFGWDDLDDLIQDVRIRVWKALSQTRERGTPLLPSYMYRVVTTATVDFLRGRRRGNETRAPLERADAIAVPPLQGERDVAAALESTLRHLAPDRRVAVRLHLEGKSLTDIAALLDWTPARARNLVYRGLDDLKARLTDT